MNKRFKYACWNLYGYGFGDTPLKAYKNFRTATGHAKYKTYHVAVFSIPDDYENNVLHDFTVFEDGNIFCQGNVSCVHRNECEV